MKTLLKNNQNSHRFLYKHAFEFVSTGDGYWVLKNGTRTQVIDQDANFLVGTTIKFDDGDFIKDTNDNELLVFGVTASAVNELKISNAATGNAPVLEATGTDANVDLDLTPKGTGNVSINGGQGITSSVTNGRVPFYKTAAPQALSGAGAVTVTEYKTNVTTTGVDALTLADGDIIGQMKLIQMIVDGGDGTLTPSNLSGGTTITFADAGDSALLQWDGTNWVAIDLFNRADGATAPVLA